MSNKINHKLIDFACGKSTSKVNIYTGGLVLEAPLFSIGTETNSFRISLQYQSSIDFNLTQLLESKTSLPEKWKLSIYHFLVKDENNDSFNYYDDKGYKHNFIKYKLNTYHDESGTGLTLTKDLYNNYTG